jgi:hypothetical protein
LRAKKEKEELERMFKFKEDKYQIKLKESSQKVSTLNEEIKKKDKVIAKWNMKGSEWRKEKESLLKEIVGLKEEVNHLHSQINVSHHAQSHTTTMPCSDLDGKFHVAIDEDENSSFLSSS